TKSKTPSAEPNSLPSIAKRSHDEPKVSAGADAGTRAARAKAVTLDDATDMLMCEFSLDGGATFQSPFPAMHVFNAGVQDYVVLLGASRIVPPPPPPTPILVPSQSFLLKNPGAPTSHKLRINVKDRDTAFGGFAYAATQGAVLTVRVDDTTQCFPLPAGPSWT